MNPQPLEALKVANRWRFAMADIRRELGDANGSGALHAAELLREPSEAVSRMRTRYLLCAIRWIGRTRATSLLHDAGIPTAALEWRVGPAPDSQDARSLTERQRMRLAEMLEQVAERQRVPSPA